MEPFSLSPANAAIYTGLGLTTIKKLIRTGALVPRKDGRRTLLLRTDLEAYVLSLKTGRGSVPRGERGRFMSR
jgi:excisionase family DNA binding protein